MYRIFITELMIYRLFGYIVGVYVIRIPCQQTNFICINFMDLTNLFR